MANNMNNFINPVNSIMKDRQSLRYYHGEKVTQEEINSNLYVHLNVPIPALNYIIDESKNLIANNSYCQKCTHETVQYSKNLLDIIMKISLKRKDHFPLGREKREKDAIPFTNIDAVTKENNICIEEMKKWTLGYSDTQKKKIDETEEENINYYPGFCKQLGAKGRRCMLELIRKVYRENPSQCKNILSKKMKPPACISNLPFFNITMLWELSHELGVFNEALEIHRIYGKNSTETIQPLKEDFKTGDIPCLRSAYHTDGTYHMDDGKYVSLCADNQPLHKNGEKKNRDRAHNSNSNEKEKKKKRKHQENQICDSKETVLLRNEAKQTCLNYEKNTIHLQLQNCVKSENTNGGSEGEKIHHYCMTSSHEQKNYEKVVQPSEEKNLNRSENFYSNLNSTSEVHMSNHMDGKKKQKTTDVSLEMRRKYQVRSNHNEAYKKGEQCDHGDNEERIKLNNCLFFNDHCESCRMNLELGKLSSRREEGETDMCLKWCTKRSEKRNAKGRKKKCKKVAHGKDTTKDGTAQSTRVRKRYQFNFLDELFANISLINATLLKTYKRNKRNGFVMRNRKFLKSDYCLLLIPFKRKRMKGKMGKEERKLRKTNLTDRENTENRANQDDRTPRIYPVEEDMCFIQCDPKEKSDKKEMKKKKNFKIKKRNCSVRKRRKRKNNMSDGSPHKNVTSKSFFHNTWISCANKCQDTLDDNLFMNNSRSERGNFKIFNSSLLMSTCGKDSYVTKSEQASISTDDGSATDSGNPSKTEKGKADVAVGGKHQETSDYKGSMRSNDPSYSDSSNVYGGNMDERDHRDQTRHLQKEKYIFENDANYKVNAGIQQVIQQCVTHKKRNTMKLLKEIMSNEKNVFNCLKNRNLLIKKKVISNTKVQYSSSDENQKIKKEDLINFLRQRNKSHMFGNERSNTDTIKSVNQQNLICKRYIKEIRKNMWRIFQLESPFYVTRTKIPVVLDVHGNLRIHIAPTFANELDSLKIGLKEHSFHCTVRKPCSASTAFWFIGTLFANSEKGKFLPL
ncbi:conserved Plasmodium protein, unknown function [Plasmodium ovale curtisi]|uniref:Uncharacterized protein n=1 Tax=Plasmodium ovale curtisi TaxID=864141 RepID=A0A1A8W2F0_PLAOA|nr:conserved Plasmodium protein, unknown function [Plasmodium ovale curtisi]